MSLESAVRLNSEKSNAFTHFFFFLQKIVFLPLVVRQPLVALVSNYWCPLLTPPLHTHTHLFLASFFVNYDCTLQFLWLPSLCERTEFVPCHFRGLNNIGAAEFYNLGNWPFIAVVQKNWACLFLIACAFFFFFFLRFNIARTPMRRILRCVLLAISSLYYTRLKRKCGTMS